MGCDGARAAGIGAQIVWPRQFGDGHQRFDAASGREAGIGADIGEDIGLERDEPAVVVEDAFQFDPLIAAVKSRDEIVAAILDPGDAVPQSARQPDQHDIFRRQRHFLAEAAADIRSDHAQIGFGKAENVGNRGARQMRHLRRAGQRDAARGGIECRVPGARFERGCVLPVRLHDERKVMPPCDVGRLEFACRNLSVDDDIAELMDCGRVR